MTTLSTNLPVLPPVVQPLALLAPSTEDETSTLQAELTIGQRPLTLRMQHEAHRTLRARAVGWH